MNMESSEQVEAEPVPDLIGKDFLYIARRLREIQDGAPGSFAIIAKYNGIGLRKAYALAQIDRCFEALNIDPKQLRRVGWSKLRTLCPHITIENCKKLLSLAETVSAQELAAALREAEFPKSPRCVILYLSSSQYELFQTALIAHGAKKSGRGLADKEIALTKVLKNVQPDSGLLP